MLFESLTQSLSRDVSSLLDTLKEAALLINASTAPGTLVKANILQILKRIKNHFQYQVYLPLAKLYLQLINLHEELEKSTVLLLCNNIFEVCEDIKGTQIAEELLNNVKPALVWLKSTEQDHDTIETLNELLKAYEIPNYDLQFNEALNEIREGKVHGMSSLIEFFSTFNSIDTQYKIFLDKFEIVLLEIEKIHNSEIITSLIKLLEMFVFDSKFSVIFNGNVDVYQVSNVKIPENIFEICLRALQIIIPYEVEVSEKALEVLSRLWKTFPAKRERLYDIFRIFISDISAEGSISLKKKASKFLYEIYNSELKSVFKQWLDVDKTIKPLLSNADFKPADIKIHEISSIPASIGCALTANIPAGTDFSYYFETSQENSLLLYGFASKYYDVTFKIERMDFSENLFIEEHVQCDENPRIGYLHIQIPGLYRLVWVNSFSWFNSKQIRYRVVLLTPIKAEVLPIKAKEKIIFFNHSLTTPSAISIGVWVKPIIEMYYQGVSTELSSILDIYDVIQKLPESTNITVGIIGPVAEVLPKLDLPNVYICKDSDALAYFGIENYENSVVVAVVNEAGVRLSVANAKKIIISYEVKGEVIEELGKILCLFGPAVVLLAGTQLGSTQDLEKLLEKYVSIEILEQTYIKQNNYLIMSAAARLYAFKKAFDSN